MRITARTIMRRRAMATLTTATTITITTSTAITTITTVIPMLMTTNSPPPVDGRYLEYPVLTGAVMAVTSWLVGTEGTPSERMVRFYDITALLLLGFALLTVAAVWATRPRGPTAAVMVALSPALLLTATINWDLIAVAFTSLAVYAWSRHAFWWTGVFIGLGAAAKFYPLFLLGPVLVLVLHRVLARRRGRDGDLPAWPVGPGVVLLRVLAASVLTWAAINAPVALANREGWLEFYTFSQDLNTQQMG